MDLKTFLIQTKESLFYFCTFLDNLIKIFHSGVTKSLSFNFIWWYIVKHFYVIIQFPFILEETPLIIFLIINSVLFVFVRYSNYANDDWSLFSLFISAFVFWFFSYLTHPRTSPSSPHHVFKFIHASSDSSFPNAVNNSIIELLFLFICLTLIFSLFFCLPLL